MAEIDDNLKQAFRDAGSDDAVKSIVAWGRLERAGMAKSFVVGGRFVHLSFTEEGRLIRDEVRRTDATTPTLSRSAGERKP